MCIINSSLSFNSEKPMTHIKRHSSVSELNWAWWCPQCECVNSTSLSLCLCLHTEFSLCLCLHTEFSLCLCHNVYHHKWADAQFFMVDAQFFGADAQSFRVDAQFFAAGLLWPRNYAFFCCWTTFTLEIMVLCHVYPLLSMCKLCLPLTEHVQTLYWACAEIIYIIYPVFDSFDW